MATMPAPPTHAPVLDLAMSGLVARALFTVTERGVPDLLASGPLGSAEIAGATGARPHAMHQVLRALAAAGYFRTDGSGRFALTVLGETLRTGHPSAARDLVLTMCGPSVSAALARFPESVDTGRPGVDLEFGEPFFDHLHSRPDEAASFNRMMISIHGTEPAAVAQAYDFSGVGHVVDVGGGIGTMLRTVLEANPGLRGTLFDLPSVLVQAREHLADLGGRCDLAGGSFFDGVPAGADAYLLSHIVHDWNIDACRTILGHCRDALAPGGRVLIVEMVLPEGDEPHPGKLLDLAMLALVGGQERTGEEYRELLAGVGLEMTRIVPTASAVSVIEAVRAGD
ncbi:methyltransferase [Pseudonocardia bannensis]|uniref:Methyltransferase n=1 Tax=Pseudonocardia bannensis TaxID=630973 RepID=A0A848DB07_9PSEU|nr:methyltransferase [Pseudonocardia bannensis]NMH90204.1 methyltransferase [Pseudonocardia bannensis]